MEQSNHNRPARPVREVQYRKSRYAAPFGGVFILLALIGVVALGSFCIQFTRGLLDNSSEKEMFEQVISPVLMFDPVPFENASDADPVFLLRSSLWSTMLGEKRDSYQFDALGRLIVPASDVDVACARLFGPNIKLQHQTFGDYEIAYVYDEATKTYFAPVALQTNQYTPSVERVVKKGDVFTLTVGYIPPANAWTQAKNGDIKSTVPEKEMLYELLKVKDHYQLTAIRDLPQSNSGASSAVTPSGAKPAVPANAVPETTSDGMVPDSTDDTAA